MDSTEDKQRFGTATLRLDYPYNQNPPEWNKPFENIELVDPSPGDVINEVMSQLNPEILWSKSVLPISYQ